MSFFIQIKHFVLVNKDKYFFKTYLVLKSKKNNGVHRELYIISRVRYETASVVIISVLLGEHAVARHNLQSDGIA